MEVTPPSRSQEDPYVVQDDESMEIPERDQSSTDESFSFTESLSQNETFQEATLVATLAETFGLTKFKSFQKEIIKATLAGKIR